MPTTAEDRDAIRDLYARYANDVDAGSARAKEWAQHYAEDGVFDTGPGNDDIVGREALEAFCAQFPTSGIRHVLSNLVIDVDGDDAHCEAFVLVIMKHQIVSTGIARDDLRRIDGRWQITYRTFTPDGV
jgi:uncharacterized protein (TIGR02246 family)